MSDLTIYRGEVKTFSGTATNNGNALNLTGAVLYFTVRTADPASSLVSDADTGAVIKKISSTSAQISIISATAGTFEIYLVKADTNALTPGMYIYGLEVILSGATDPVVLSSGYFKISPDIVRGA